MTSEERAWQVLTALLAVLTMAVPLWFAIDQFDRGSDPEKHIELQSFGPINPLSDLAQLANDTALELTIGDETFDDVAIWSLELRNSGKSPITAGDFFQNLRVSVKSPWQIIGIRKDKYYTGPITVAWTRRDAQSFEAAPFLFNPGDRIQQNVYLTVAGSDASEANVPEPEVTARITNLKEFTRPKGDASSQVVRTRRHALVYLSNRDTVLLLILASALLAWYLRQLHRARMLPSGTRGIPAVVACALLSFATAEVLVYYAFGGNPYLEMIVGRRALDWRVQYLNWSVLALHVVTSIALVRRAGPADSKLRASK